MQQGTLMERTRHLLGQCDKTLPQIAEDTKISFYWLRKFKSGSIVDPSVNKVQRLYEYLTGDKLKLNGRRTA